MKPLQTSIKGRPKGVPNKVVLLTVGELTDLLGSNSPIKVPVSNKWYKTISQ
jgi:hypothetical protein